LLGLCAPICRVGCQLGLAAVLLGACAAPQQAPSGPVVASDPNQFDDTTLPPTPSVAAPNKARALGSLRALTLKPGSGNTYPNGGSMVLLHYAGWTTDGSLFDATFTDGKPKVIDLSRAISGWSTAVQSMVVGERTQFWIPADEAYGANPGNKALPAGDLIFEIELLRIVRL